MDMADLAILNGRVVTTFGTGNLTSLSSKDGFMLL